MERVRVALLGTGFIANLHMESFDNFVGEAEVTAVYSHNGERAKAFAEAKGIPRWYADMDALFKEGSFDVADICLPNYLHCQACVKALSYNKHVIIEKPLAMNLEEADVMIAEAKKRNLTIMYAEDLCFTPKYERARTLIEQGAIGKPYLLKQCEKHSGPHSRWFYEKEKSGGGAMMDIGCHGIAWFLWMNKNSPVKSVYADMRTVLHDTDCEDNSLCIVEFENGVNGIAEDSWTKPGGMDDNIEIYGTKGVIYADLVRGNTLLTYSAEGYDYAVEKADSSKGWSFTAYEEAFNSGYPQELRHFVRCVRDGTEPLLTAEDGKRTLEVIYAAYASAKTGAKVSLPFRPKVKYPVDLYLG
jgi:predicted dehydrogenase